MMFAPEVNYQRIADALRFYQGKGYELVHVDWTASKSVMDITRPHNAPVVNDVAINPDSETMDDRYLVASGEQSLIEAFMNEKVTYGKYVTCTPCFRVSDAFYSKLHHPFFMKVELIQFCILPATSEHVEEMMTDAYGFHEAFMDRKFLSLRPTIENGSYDLEFKGQEVGSYGRRSNTPRDLHWVYGTGLAEPRVTQLVNA